MSIPFLSFLYLYDEPPIVVRIIGVLLSPILCVDFLA